MSRAGTYPESSILMEALEGWELIFCKDYRDYEDDF